jgi:ABC-type amino acid transport substrate-binding protein
MRPSRILKVLLVVALVAAMGLLPGCSRKAKTPAGPEPKVKPPVVLEAGTLKVGVDLDYPPFGGTDNGKQAGIDVEVAKAIAGDLGLKAELVSVQPSEAASALASRTVDVVVSVPIEPSSVASMSIAGSYIADGPAFFTTAEETLTLDTIGDRTVGAQKGSEAYWELVGTFGVEKVGAFTSLRAGFGALVDGKVSVLAGDGLVGGYIGRDFPEVHFAGQLGEAHLLAAAVAPENTELSEAVSATMSKLAVKGVFRTIRSTWVDGLPELYSAMPGASVDDALETSAGPALETTPVAVP